MQRTRSSILAWSCEAESRSPIFRTAKPRAQRSPSGTLADAGWPVERRISSARSVYLRFTTGIRAADRGSLTARKREACPAPPRPRSRAPGEARHVDPAAAADDRQAPPAGPLLDGAPRLASVAPRRE